MHVRQEVWHILVDGDAEGVRASLARLEQPPAAREQGGASGTNRGF